MATPLSSTDLTARQRDVLALVLRGHTNGEIGERLGISAAGAKWHVAELLDRYNVATREELIAAVEADRAPRARFRRMAAALAGLLPAKAAAAFAVAGLAAIGSLTVVFVAIDGRGGPPTPPVAPTSVSLPPAVADARWTPAEAYGHALADAAAMLKGQVDGRRLAAITTAQLTLAESRWLPQATSYDAPDGDHYWTAAPGEPKDLWLFRWTAGNVVLGDRGIDSVTPVPPPTTLTLELLLIDGGDGQPFLSVFTVEGAFRNDTGFRSRSLDAHAHDNDPAGPDVPVATLNNIPGAETMSVHRTQGGGWCTSTSANRGAVLCVGPVQQPDVPMVYAGPSTTVSADGVKGPRIVTVWASADVAQVRFVFRDGSQLTFATNAAPPALGLDYRFAYVDLGIITQPYGTYGLDANGNQVVYNAANDLR
jgi:DNA-binding CsgD family transcriptional regulator